MATVTTGQARMAGFPSATSAAAKRSASLTATFVRGLINPLAFAEIGFLCDVPAFPPQEE